MANWATETHYVLYKSVLAGWRKSEKAQSETEKRLFVAPPGLYVELFWQLRR